MKIVFATDGSEEAGSACRLLEMLPLPEGSEIQVVSVVPGPALAMGPFGDGFFVVEALYEVRAAERELAQKALDEAVERLARDGVAVGTSLRDGDPAHEILAAAEGLDADLVMVGSRGLTGLDEILLGSVARNVAKHCKRPVLVARAPGNALREVIVAADGSEQSKQALRFAARLPLPRGAHTTLVHVVRPYAPFSGLFSLHRERFQETVREVNEKQREVARSLAAQAAQELAASGKQVETEIREGDPAAEILALAGERRADLIIAGARGTSLIQSLRVGSVADRLLKEARCSVLIVH